MYLRSMARAVGLLMFLCIEATATASAASDPSQFTLAGLRIGMTEREARSVISHYSGAAMQLLGQGSVACAADWSAALRRRNTRFVPSHCASEITSVSGSAIVSVHLIEDYPTHPGVMRVYAIGYVQSDLQPGGSERAALTARMIQRFGPPELYEGLDLYWGFYAWLAVMKGVAKTPDDFFVQYPDGTLGNPAFVWDAVPTSVQSAADLDVIFRQPEVRMFLYDSAYASTRSAALRAAYDAVELPALKTTF